MAKGAAAANSLLNLIFQATEWVGIARNDSAPLTQLFVALHSADPTPGGNQSSNEVTYSGYARVAIARTGSGWTTASAQSVSPQATITFPVGVGGVAGVAAFWSIGTALTGPGSVLYSGPVTPNIVTGPGIAPQLAANSTVTEA